MLNHLERHTLLFLTAAGREEAWSLRSSFSEEDRDCWSAYPDIPAIFTGRTDAHGRLQIGFSFPRRTGAVRCRMASRVSAQGAAGAVTPWEAARMSAVQTGLIGDLVRRLKEAAGAGVRLGIFGAAALQAVTGLPYLHSGSDLDIVLRVSSRRQLEAFWPRVRELESGLGVPIDAEVRLGPRQYAKCKELFSAQCTVLMKGGEPYLLSRCAAWALLPDS